MIEIYLNFLIICLQFRLLNIDEENGEFYI
jgi:hypothetical protein